ncbi:MAG TPA: hypothetical protein VJ911_03445 [Cryomorphaceae bacterium]|nr:hypothetical protein [Cryomorphaceae bacterium]
MTSPLHSTDKIREYLGEDSGLLEFNNPKIGKERIYHPGIGAMDDIFGTSDRNTRTLVNLSRLYNHGRLGGSGYLSILPVDQGLEHTGGSSFAPNPDYFDPEKIIELAMEGGCNGVATTFGASPCTRENMRIKFRL